MRCAAMATTAVMAVMAMVAATAMSGCQSGGGKGAGFTTAGPVGINVPKPLDLLLPQSIRIHPFTSVRMLDEAKGTKGLEVRIEALDAYQENTKAFGDVRFELYRYREQSADPRGKMVNSWDVSIMNPKENLVHWDRITRAYIFKLQLFEKVPQGQPLVLVAVYSSPFTKRMTAQYVIPAR